MKKSAYLMGVFILLLSVIATSCGSTASKQSLATIEGVIMDEFSNTPLPGVRISLEGTSFSSNTDESGYFKFDGLEEGSYTVVVEKDGYEPKNTSVSVTAGSNSNVEVATSMRLSWDFDVTDRNHTLGILSNGEFNINGGGLENGDIIGVFYLKDGAFQCGGRTQRPWDGNSTAIAAYGDDTFTEGIKDGFNDGEEFVWVLRKPNRVTYRLRAIYEQGNNSFVTNGISKIVGFELF